MTTKTLFTLPEGNNWDSPMIDTHFHNWLMSHGTGNTFADKVDYLEMYGFDRELMRIDPDDLKTLSYIHNHWAWLKYKNNNYFENIRTLD